jgi:HEAT repeat protein/beta-lactamase regulating signal transducer with metallopeptidase domain
VTLANLDAFSAAAIAWLLTYAIHSTILLGAARAIAARFADEHAWLDLVWKTALLGPIVTASLQIGADVIPLGGRWPLRTVTAKAVAAPERVPELKFGPTYEKVAAQERVPELKFGVPELKFGPTYDKGGAGSAVRRAELQFRQALPSEAPLSKASSMWPVFAVAAWLAISAVGLARFGTRFIRLHRSLRSGPPVSAPHLHQMIEALSQSAGTRAPIRLTTSTTCTVPLALAGRQVVLPERFLQLDAEQQHAALAHEVAHVVRRDPAWRVLAGVLERALFFQPLNHVARVRLCESAEFLCDQWAVQHTRAPLALARCLSAVAAWASPGRDEALAGASPMAHNESPLVRRVTRILADGSRGRRPPSIVWLAGALIAVATVAPLVTAAQLAGPAASARIATDPAEHAAVPAGDKGPAEKASAPQIWTATEMAKARADLRILRPPRPADPLNVRWQWALAEAARQGVGGFWVVYSFQTPTRADSLMMSDTREGSFVSMTGQLRSSGPSLSVLLDDPAPIDAGNVTVLMHYGAARADAIDRAGYRSTRLGFDFGRAPIFWLGAAPEVESFERVRDLFGQSRPEKIKILLIELASLHPTTDLVLPFLTRLVDPSNPLAIRREATEGFEHHHDPRSVEILLRVARIDAASEVRAEAAETIGEVQTPQSVPALSDLATNSPDPAVRREAAESFADQPPDLAVPAIERFLAISVDDDALGEAIEALGEIKDARVLPLLIRSATSHSSRRAQQEAVETLGEVEDSAADAALVRIVWEQKDETIQREAVETLGDRTPAPVAELERILRDHPVEGVQAEAIETLADAAGHRLSASILDVAASGKSSHIRREAIEAIADAASNTTDVETLDKAQRVIEHAIFDDADHDVQMEALDALDELPRDRAVRVLRSVIDRHTDADIREEAQDQLHDRERTGASKP